MTTATGTVGAVLLAAGGSRRLGRPKQLLELDGRSFARRAADTLIASRARPLVAVLGAEAGAVAATLPAELPTVVNANWQAGQSTSIRAGLDALLDAADRPVDGVLFVPCDQPALTAATLDRSIGALRDADSTEHIVVPVYGSDRRRSAPVLFGRPFFEALRALTGDTGGRTLLRAFADRVIELRIDDGEQAADVDTVEDWRRIESLATPHEPFRTD
ncbi:MAG: nucleotidyltransferase family protein [Acidobacteriota bacterium]